MDQKYALKRSLRKVINELPEQFMQVQRAYMVNRNYIDYIRNSMVEVRQHLISIGRAYRKRVLTSIQSG
ncbi:LytTR family transcriptional regulator DNA-binding domain-containing protein [Spirosoma foliorum]|uniref:LytTR family transcriptional regulator DNA-binding domain-containing protein n=1 Tax=Spirosoma foliorum TaxID=2710596 RepID=A0A7G5GZ68_9BACT|nr:LytTR family transcriptional regulator DNA-binding domain-containing protein [Spirosoma foliorum]QMW04160.1 LytTR family transcriptional regulator DNA-binding domain-containing protein [Spirosoma foliorum]